MCWHIFHFISLFNLINVQMDYLRIFFFLVLAECIYNIMLYWMLLERNFPKMAPLENNFQKLLLVFCFRVLFLNSNYHSSTVLSHLCLLLYLACSILIVYLCHFKYNFPKVWSGREICSPNWLMEWKAHLLNNFVRT